MVSFLAAVLSLSSALPALPALPALSAGQDDSPKESAEGVIQEERSAEAKGDANSPSRLPDMPLPLQEDGVPDRPFTLELGEPFLGSGPLMEGIELPGGAVLQPAILIFGTYRTAVQTFDNGPTSVTELTHRLDLFGQLKLTGTERVVVGFRPFDDGTQFSRYTFSPEDDEGGETFKDGDLEALFFEGDIGEILPFLDDDDTGMYDFGFSVGRQSLLVQDGVFINDVMDGVGIIRNNLMPWGANNLQVTGFFAWADVHRDDNLEDHDAFLGALLAETDLSSSTVELDLAYVHSNRFDSGDGAFAALSAVQRIGNFNTTFRAATSQALDDETPETTTGYLGIAEVSLTPHKTEDVAYVNAFLAADHFSSAARGPATGGPLGRVGILFAAQGLGRTGAPLSNQAERAGGGSVGYQKIFHHGRRQVIFEFGGRRGTDGDPRTGAVAVGARYQHAVGNRAIVQLDAFVAKQERRDDGWGARIEFRIQF